MPRRRIVSFAASPHPLMDLAFDLPPDARAAARARVELERVKRLLAPEAFEDLRLVVTELVTNSVKYGPGQPITVRLSVAADGTVSGEVEDQGEPTTPLRVAERTDPLHVGGLGLAMLDRICDDWGVREGSTHVWFVMRP